MVSPLAGPTDTLITRPTTVVIKNLTRRSRTSLFRLSGGRHSEKIHLHPSAETCLTRREDSNALAVFSIIPVLTVCALLVTNIPAPLNFSFSSGHCANQPFQQGPSILVTDCSFRAAKVGKKHLPAVLYPPAWQDNLYPTWKVTSRLVSTGSLSSLPG